MVFYFLKVILLVFSKNACVVTNYEFGQITSLKLNVESVESLGGGFLSVSYCLSNTNMS